MHFHSAAFDAEIFYLLALNVWRFERLLTNPKVHIFISMVFPLLSFIAAYDSSFYVVTVSVVSLANALVCVASLEAKLKATSKALKETNAAKASADKTAKAAEARGIKAEKALAEVSQKQAKREEDIVK
jgi:general stress protein CsbA